MDGAGELVALAGAVGNDRPGRCSSKGELSRSSHRAHSPCGTRDSQLSLLRNHLHKLLAEHRPRDCRERSGVSTGQRMGQELRSAPAVPLALASPLVTSETSREGLDRHFSK